MKKLLLSFITATLLSSMSAGSAGAQELPEQKETLATIVKVNDYFMKKYADYTLPSFFGRVRPSNIWTRGVYYEGLIALYSIYPREDYYSYTYDWANFHKWGMRNGNTTRNADDQCCGQVYIDLYNMCPSDPNMIRNIKASIDMVVNTPQVNDWDWIDAIQMAMPIYAKFGKMTGEQKYYNKMWDLYTYTRNTHGEAGMYNAKEGLWWRDQDFDPPYKEPNGKNCYWSRGNGWVFYDFKVAVFRTDRSESVFKVERDFVRRACRKIDRAGVGDFLAVMGKRKRFGLAVIHNKAGCREAADSGCCGDVCAAAFKTFKSGNGCGKRAVAFGRKS